MMIDWSTFRNSGWLGTNYWDKKISEKDNLYFDDVFNVLLNNRTQVMMRLTEATITESFNEINGNFYLN